MLTNRRDFLRTVTQTATVVAVGSQVPEFWCQAAAAEAGGRGETILVVLQLSGGNDGLNTVIPFGDDAYRRARPKLAISVNDVLKIDEQFGFHPAARGLANLLEAGQLAIVQGVGYEQPNRSHFESMDIWHTCHRKGGPRTTGWLGRYFDSRAGKLAQADTPGLHLGGEKQPLALIAEKVRVPSISSPEKFRLNDSGDPALLGAIRELAGSPRSTGDDLLGFLQTSTSSALTDSDRIAAALRDYQTPVKYPENALAKKFKTVAQLISAGLKTRVYYLDLDGFDTHSQQAPAHTALLQQAGGSLQAFLEDVQHQGQADRVLVMCFSEFGRRVQENASEGTDHGAAAPMFLVGKPVKPGLIGKHPSLTDLDDGDLKFHTDFRQVYATVLQRWLGWDSAAAVLGGEFEMVPAIEVT
jgi:uncharacterized protein (DUF1501 family)